LVETCAILDDVLRRIHNRILNDKKLEEFLNIKEHDVFEARMLEMLFQKKT